MLPRFSSDEVKPPDHQTGGFIMIILESSAAHATGRAGTGAGRVVVSLSGSGHVSVQEQISVDGDLHTAGFHVGMGSALFANTL